MIRMCELSGYKKTKSMNHSHRKMKERGRKKEGIIHDQDIKNIFNKVIEEKFTKVLKEMTT